LAGYASSTVGSSHPVQEHAFIFFLAGPDGSSSKTIPYSRYLMYGSSNYPNQYNGC
jgi:hypothetical protein